MPTKQRDRRHDRRRIDERQDEYDRRQQHEAGELLERFHPRARLGQEAEQLGKHADEQIRAGHAEAEAREDGERRGERLRDGPGDGRGHERGGAWRGEDRGDDAFGERAERAFFGGELLSGAAAEEAGDRHFPHAQAGSAPSRTRSTP